MFWNRIIRMFRKPETTITLDTSGEVTKGQTTRRFRVFYGRRFLAGRFRGDRGLIYVNSERT